MFGFIYYVGDDVLCGLSTPNNMIHTRGVLYVGSIHCFFVYLYIVLIKVSGLAVGGCFLRVLCKIESA